MTIATTPTGARPQVALPPVRGLNEGQVRGAACVWCARPLDNGSAIDLGPRRLRLADIRVRWFPRACPTCGETGGQA